MGTKTVSVCQFAGKLKSSGKLTLKSACNALENMSLPVCRGALAKLAN
jgi:hypothetical protein